MSRIKAVLGNFYHTILHKIRQSPLLHTVAINKMVKKSIVSKSSSSKRELNGDY